MRRCVPAPVSLRPATVISRRFATEPSSLPSSLLEASNRVRRPLGGRNVELLEQPLGDRLSDAARAELRGDAFDANLVQLVERHQRVAVLGGRRRRPRRAVRAARRR